MTKRMLLALLIAFGLLAAACSGDDSESTETDDTETSTDEDAAETESDESDDGNEDDADEPEAEDDTEPVEDVELTASWDGVTEDAIRLGFTTSDLQELKEIGLVDLDRGDPQVVLDALVDDVNARGGINGRMIEATLEVLIPFDTEAADEACVRFTEDIEVFAVLAPFVGPNTEVNPCINDLNETIIVGGQPTPEQLDRSKAPWISNTMFSQRRLEGVVQLMEDEGLLGDTVGVVVNAEEQAAADDIVIPALEALDKTVVSVVQDTPAGDVPAGEAAWSTFIQRFEAEGVDSVVMVENTGTFGSSQLARSELDAQFLIVDSAQLIRGLGNLGVVAPAELDGVIGSDTGSAEERWELESTQECIRVVEEANPEIDIVPSEDVPEGESDWFGNVEIFCAPLRLFELAAGAAGAELTHDSFVTGAESLGEIDIPAQVFASMGPDKYDAGDGVRLAVFDSTLGDNGDGATFAPTTRIE